MSHGAPRCWAGILRRDPRAALGPWWRCPVCGWLGPFVPFNGRPYACCPACRSLERHRLQALVLLRVWPATAVGSVLHAAPEPVIAAFLAARAHAYLTFDLGAGAVDLHTDMRLLPFRDATFEVVHASHVLEHIREDRAAIAEAYRVLTPAGLALLPVPIVAPRTVEYAAPRADEHQHMRAPGPDYFDRMREAGFAVEVYTSASFPAGRHQLLIHPPGGGPPTADHVPVCRKPGR